MIARPRRGAAAATLLALVAAGATVASATSAAAPAAVAAAATWRAEPMPGATGGLPPAHTLAFDRDGRALALFEGFLQSRQPSRFTGIELRAPSGGWTRAGDVSGIGWGAAQALLYGRSRALLVTRQVTGVGKFNRARFRLVWAVGRSDGTFGSFRQIAASADVPAAAANPSGDALVAFAPQGATGVRVSERRAGGRFGAARLIGPGGFSPAVAINARGDRLVAWSDAHGLKARVAPAGESWGPIRTISSDRGVTVRALVTTNGRVALAWERATLVEGRPGRLVARAAVAARGGSGWHTATLTNGALPSGSFAADAVAVPLVDSSGRLFVAYTAVHGTGTAVALANLSPTARVTSTTIVSGDAANATLDDAAAGASGGLAVTWAVHDPVSSTVRTFATLRTPSGTFEPGTDLTQPGESDLVGSRVAFSPLTGEAVVVRGIVAGGVPQLTSSVGTP